MDVTGKKYLTIQVETSGEYVIEYSTQQYVDILNNTSSSIKISTDEITSDDYVLVPAGGAYNSLHLTGGKLYVIANAAGDISVIAR